MSARRFLEPARGFDKFTSAFLGARRQPALDLNRLAQVGGCPSATVVKHLRSAVWPEQSCD
jgi:hypothetical protein